MQMYLSRHKRILKTANHFGGDIHTLLVPENGPVPKPKQLTLRKNANKNSLILFFVYLQKSNKTQSLMLRNVR